MAASDPMNLGWIATLAAALVLCGLLVLAARTDLTQRRIPNALNLALLVLGLAVAFIGVGVVPWPMALAGAGAGLAVTGLARLLLGPEKIGMGDVKMTTALGAWLGLVGLAVATLVASVALIVCALLRREREAAPFAPFLGGGTVVAYGLALWAAWGGLA